MANRPSGPASAPRPTVRVVAFLAIAVSAASYHSLLQGGAWWFVVVGVSAVVSIAMAVSHLVARRAIWPPIAGIIAAIVSLTVFFAPTHAWLFLIPNLDTASAFGTLVSGGMDSIAVQGTPAEATVGIVFLLAAGFAIVTVLVDLLVFTIARPALVGIPLLALIAVPALIDTSVSEPWFFVLVAAAYLVLLLAVGERRQNRVAVGVGATAIVGALILSVALPQVSQDNSPSSQLQGFSTGVNPFINLGEDLRRPNPVEALTYTTTSTVQQYFTLSVLEDFSGGEWQPTVTANGDRDLGSIGPVPGRADGATVQDSSTKITVGAVSGSWLPLPYAPQKVTGLDGDWAWNPTTLTVGSTSASMRGQDYTVQTQAATPTAVQLNATGTTVDTQLLAEDLTLPTNLPSIVADTATQVVDDAKATTNYQKGVALQNYFQSNLFTYSTEAPVDEGYDGSSASVIATFLEKKEGYCVHFSSAMATMARTLGIPARIGVGFTTGTSSLDLQTRQTLWTVSTDDLHAWPELYFDKIGWVRFEPTPGRGNIPFFGSLNDPAKPQFDDSRSTATATPSATPSSSAASTASATPTAAATSPLDNAAMRQAIGTIVLWVAIGIVVLFILFLPAIVRRSRRVRRLAQVRSSGSALDAWAELRDTAHDLGYPSRDVDTPRTFATTLAAVSTASGQDALSRLLVAVEGEAYSPGGRGGARVEDVRDASAALRRFAGARARWRARLLPASVLQWFRRGPAVPPPE